MKHAPTSQLRKILVSAAAVLCCAIGLLAGGAPARAVESQDKTFAASYRISTVSALGVGKHTAASAACAPALNKYDRTRACWDDTITFTFFQDEEPVGTLVAVLVQSIHLNASGRNWAESDTVVSLAGSAASKGNRKVICERGWHPFGPWVAGKLKVEDGCDEFPFAATYQSGATKVSTGKDCAQVEAVKTSGTGSEAKIWNAVRPIWQAPPRREMRPRPHTANPEHRPRP